MLINWAMRRGRMPREAAEGDKKGHLFFFFEFIRALCIDYLELEVKEGTLHSRGQWRQQKDYLRDDLSNQPAI